MNVMNVCSVLLLSLLVATTETHALFIRIRDDGGGSPPSQDHIQEWVVKLIVIGLVLFIAVLLSLYLYRQCKLNGRTPSPMYQLPNPVSRDGSRRRRWPFAGAAPSAPALIRVTTSSDDGIGLVAPARVPKAHVKSRTTAPAAGTPFGWPVPNTYPS